MPQFVVVGEALIDVFAEKGVPLRTAKSLSPAPGGSAANVVVALARLGAEVGFIGKVGVDDFGTYLIDLLTNEGVDMSHFEADPGGPTMLAIVATPSATEQQFILYNGANGLLSPEELPQDYITSAEIFVYGSVILASNSRSAALQAAQWARSKGRQVVFDVNLRPLLWPNLNEAREQIEKGLAAATVAKLNETELEFLTGLSDPAQGSQQLIEQGLQLCCVSLGADGSYFNNGTVQGHVPALSVDVQDTTGSGDAFVAGLSYQISKVDGPLTNLDSTALNQIVSFANACGALTATQVGGMSASPTLETVEQTLQNR